MGSGKTTLGKKLANKLGWKFIDLDEVIVEFSGQPIQQYFEQYGEPSFREMEAACLRNLDFEQPMIVATGGGTPCYHANMEWMNREGKTMYLHLEPKAIWQRLRQTRVQSRPVLEGRQGQELLEFITEKLKERSVWYKQAQYQVNPIRMTL